MNAAQRQLLLFGSLMSVLLAPYFNPFLDSISKGVAAVESRIISLRGVQLRLFCARPGSTTKPFTISLYVKGADPDQLVTLQLPEGMTLADGQQAERGVPPPGENEYSQVIWKVKACTAGHYRVKVKAPGMGTAVKLVRVNEPTA
jgi:hypothetical protein